MVKDHSIMSEKKVPMTVLFRTAGAERVIAKSQGKSKVLHYRACRTVKWNHGPHVPNVTHNLVSFPSFCVMAHTIFCTKKEFFVNKNNTTGGVENEPVDCMMLS